MSYTTKIKNEISKIENTKSETIAELSAFIRNNGYIDDNYLYLTTENINILNRLTKFLTSIYDVKVELEKKDNLNFSKKKLNVIKIKDKISYILQDVGFYSKDNTYLDSPPNYIIGANEEI
ncbi:MAG: hypothetical protein ILA19_03865, partial [Bacilli bacterium]|nr:hypothetical protein [Bacilli bacterium]